MALSVAAVPICVAGFFFTRYVVQQIDRYDDPGRFTVDPGDCAVANRVATFDGTITNDDDGTRSYELTVVFSSGLAEVGREYVDVDDVRPGATVSWRTSGIGRTRWRRRSTATSPRCTARRRSGCARSSGRWLPAAQSAAGGRRRQPGVVHPGVHAVGLEELGVVAVLDQPPAVEHEHPVGACRGRQPVGDGDRRAPVGQLVQRPGRCAPR